MKIKIKKKIKMGMVMINIIKIINKKNKQNDNVYPNEKETKAFVNLE